MSDFTASSAPSAEPRKDGRTRYPQVFRRTFECGHPDEFIDVWQDNDGQVIHNLITLQAYRANQSIGNHTTRSKTGRLEFDQARCLSCAKKAKEKDDRDPSIQLKRSLGNYQAGTSSTFPRRSSATPRSGFDGVLERHKYSGGQDTGVQPHPRVSEEEHRAYHLEVLAEALACPGKWLAVPARRLWNAPVRTAGEVESETHQRSLFYLFEDDVKDCLQSRIDAACKNPYSRKRNSAQSDALSYDETGKVLPGSSQKPEQDKNKDNEDLIVMMTGIDHVEDLCRLSLVRTSESHHESPRTFTGNTHTLEEPESVGTPKAYMGGDQTASEGKGFLSHPASAPSTDDYALRPQSGNSSTSTGRESGFAEQLIDQYASPFDDASNPSLVDLKYKHPRPAPSLPKRGPLDFMKRRSSTSTRASTKPEPMPRNFRKLRLNLQHSAKSTKKTEPDSESPDWACQTSLAIEAGKISMDSESMRSQESASPTHISQAARSPTRIVPRGRRTVQGVKLRESSNTYPSPSVGYSPAAFMLGTHSEGAFQAVRRSSAAHQLGGLEGMEIALRQEPSRRDSAQAASPINLNKSLPDLPSPQDSGKEKEELHGI